MPLTSIIGFFRHFAKGKSRTSRYILYFYKSLYYYINDIIMF
ncbi:MAG: hypothetical protein ACLFMM_08290 [Methanohalobium sp.]